MRALTVRFPWSAAIAHGTKRTENRPKPIPPAHLGTTILIHAGLAEDDNALPAETVRAWPRHYGAIIAVADLASCHQAARPRCCAPWGFPQTDAGTLWHWQLDNVRTLPHPPRPVRGQLGLWTVDDDVLAAVRRQVEIPQDVTA
ncbi:hypothetical protein P1P75_33410 [Streptomyces sp. ID05-39B]|uniref:hypothetical protein n=1 Tax=Streptomyces sp. ID05-39B TaxID=3028664 RepID=UPI0029A84E1A|nr:hypothetical protein [Streptomyces sp. ID05-39B]MDX3531172.1 hypothetical protein [Streptomyces sp. ID05-39B]